MEELEKLIKREYMRGQIDRSNGKYSLKSLEARYKKYREDNPKITEELRDCFDNITSPPYEDDED